MDIDSFKDNVENEKLLNKPLNEGFYPILPPSVYFLDYKDVFIPIQSKGIEKKVLAATSVTVVAATSKTAAK